MQNSMQKNMKLVRFFIALYEFLTIFAVLLKKIR